MDLERTGFTRFSRFGVNLGRLHMAEEPQHTEELNGADELQITCYEDVKKSEYVVWQDRRGEWHEHIVDKHRRTHDGAGVPVTVASCINSLAETWDDYIIDRRPRGSAYAALSVVLEPTRWTAGVCTQEGTASHTFYHIHVREALQDLLEVWGGELETHIECDGSKVTAREVRIKSFRGNQASPKRFTWTKDLVSIYRDVGDTNPKSRIYAYGKGEETEGGGYGRRIGIEDVNDGLPYVEDAEATAIWGHPMPDGSIKPAEGDYVNEQCDDPATLKQEALAYLEKAKEPQVSYTADVIDLASFGRDWEDVGLGDLVTIVDKEFSEDGIRLKGRVSKIARRLYTNEVSVTFGTLHDAIVAPWHSIQSKVASLSRRSANWDLAGTAEPGWLDTLMYGLNAAYDRAGTYHHTSFEHGDIWSSVPMDDEGRPLQSGGWAMNINGLGFRLASSTNADGSWNWRTFGTGEGFVADEIVAGILHSANWATWINLINGEAMISGGSTLGDTAVSEVLQSIGDAASNISSLQDSLADTEQRLSSDIDDARRFATDYLKYANGELTLGSLESVIKLVLTYQLLKFTSSEGDVAWFGRTAEGIWNLFIETASIQNMLRFNDFAWIARANGNMTLKWVGD